VEARRRPLARTRWLRAAVDANEARRGARLGLDRLRALFDRIDVDPFGARGIVQQHYPRPLDAELAHWAYVGDSANDQVMFQQFAHSVGVANIVGVAAQLAHLPRYVTVAERGAGFAEVAAAVLAAQPDEPPAMSREP
jgi:hypothetical protein